MTQKYRFVQRSSSILLRKVGPSLGFALLIMILLTQPLLAALILDDDFDPGIDSPLWSDLVNASAGTGCGSVSGNALYFNGSGSRYAATVDLDTSSGGIVEFSLRIGTGSSPCENADSGEDVVLEYSTDGGGSWTIIDTYDQDSFATFTVQTVDIPPAAQTGATRFRWRQPQHSGSGYDNWAIDDLRIETQDDLSIHKTASADRVFPGDPLTYVIRFQNSSSLTATGVVITDVVPITLTNVSFVSSGAAITRTAGITYAWNVADLAPGTGGVITITGQVRATASSQAIFTNTATITSTEGITTNYRSSVQTLIHGALYVDQDATGANDGTSWADAFTDLQSALAIASPDDDIWVAEGIYEPTPGTDRNATFQLRNGVAIYGGFDGTEASRSQRDWEAHVTVLSGDLAGNDNSNVVYNEPTRQDNSFHVVTGSGTDATAVLDGVTVTGGNAYGGGGDAGGGMYSYRNGSPTVRNVTFISNTARSRGAGMFNYYYSSPALTGVTFSGNVVGYYGGGMWNEYYSSPVLVNVVFSGNTAGSYGGGMWNEYYSSPVLVNAVFSGNTASYLGGGMRNSNRSSPTLVNVVFSGNTAREGGGIWNYYNSSPALTNVTFSHNTASQYGGGMRTVSGGNPAVNNCIFWGNIAPSGPQISNSGSSLTVRYSLVQGGYAGTGNIDADPLFADADGPDDVFGTLDDDLRLLPGSRAIDAGDDAAVPADTADLDGDGDTAERVPLDLAGNPRIVAPAVDMGAYEAIFLIVTKTVDRDDPEPGQRITYTVTVSNSSLIDVTHAVVSDTLPNGLTFAGPVTLEGSSGTVAQDGSDLPVLASGLAISAGKRITVTFPVTVDTGLRGGTVIINTAAVTSTEVTVPTAGSRAITVANVPPVAADDVASTDEDTPVTVGVVANDGDLNGDPLSVAAVGTTANGTTAVSGTTAVVYTPTLDFNGDDTFTYTVSDGSSTDVATVTVTVDPVNDAPSFTGGADQAVDEDAGPQVVSGWATDISAGPADEASQVLTFTLTNDHNGLFAARPALAADGTLAYEPVADAHGSAVVTVTLRDSGGTAHGGVDTSAPQTFTITVNPVNDAPTLDPIADRAVDEDAGPQTVDLGGIGTGAADETQGLSVTATSTDTALIPNPAVTYASPDATGSLSFTPVADQYGQATIVVTVTDGVSDTHRSFLVTVDPVNDAPSFTGGADQTVDEDAGPQVVPGWATDMAAGPPNEASQVLTFVLTNDDNDLFVAQPDVDGTTGDLTYTPAADVNGSATVTVTLQDSGGTASGGVDTSAPQTFTITVNPVDDAPEFTSTPVKFATEDRPYTYDVTATDVDVDPSLIITAPTLPGWLALADHGDGTATLSGMPASADTGDHGVTLQVRDTTGLTGTQSFTITVGEKPIFYVYLPVMFEKYVVAPDLVIADLIATATDVRVVIKNQGSRPVTDDFWVDVYIDPAPAPTAVNQTWDQLGSQGLVWGVTADALPLQPGEVITLTVGDDYHWSDYSLVSWPLPAGTLVYAQADSFNLATTYGAVLESHEVSGGTYNNIGRTVVSSAAVKGSEAEGPAGTSGRRPAGSGDLPRRP